MTRPPVGTTDGEWISLPGEVSVLPQMDRQSRGRDGIRAKAVLHHAFPGAISTFVTDGVTLEHHTEERDAHLAHRTL